MPVDIFRVDLGAQTRTCQAHGKYTSTGQQIQLGRTLNDIWSKCPACLQSSAQQAAEDALRLVAQRKIDRIASVLDQSAIPRRFIGKGLDDFVAETVEQQKALRLCRRFANEFETVLQKGHTLIMIGKPGNGKTHLACAILQHIMPEHVGAYVTTMDLVRRLRSGWGGKGSNEAEVLAELGALPLLVIDEIGVQFGSEAERIHFHDVIDKRYRDMRPTILITNADDADFQEFVGDRVYDRLLEIGFWVNFQWASHRSTSKKVTT